MVSVSMPLSLKFVVTSAFSSDLLPWYVVELFLTNLEASRRLLSEGFVMKSPATFLYTTDDVSAPSVLWLYMVSVFIDWPL